MGPNQSQPKEGIASTIPCRVCGSTIDNNGTELTLYNAKNLQFKHRYHNKALRS